MQGKKYTWKTSGTNPAHRGKPEKTHRRTLVCDDRITPYASLGHLPLGPYQYVK